MSAQLDAEATARLLPEIDATAHRSLEALERAYAERSAPSRDSGRVALIVARLDHERRATPESAWLSAAKGVPNDRWGKGPSPDPNMQIAVMENSVAELIANGQPKLLFGDNLFVDLDLGAENLPPGSQLRAGGALLEVTPEPHDGCRLFRARFGADALRFVAAKQSRAKKLRGIYMKVLRDGELRVGDDLEVLSRGA